MVIIGSSTVLTTLSARKNNLQNFHYIISLKFSFYKYAVLTYWCIVHLNITPRPAKRVVSTSLLHIDLSECIQNSGKTHIL